MLDATSTEIQRCISRIHEGDAGARDELVELAGQRLRRLTQRLFQDFRRVRAFEETDDVVQNASLRLLRRLKTHQVTSMQDFLCLAAREIRCELIDLARHYFGPHGAGANLAPPHRNFAGGPMEETVDFVQEESDATHEPTQLACWTEFHEHVEALPEDEKEIFDLVWYHGMTHLEAADVIGMSVATVKRRWMSARLRLQNSLQFDLPSN